MNDQELNELNVLEEYCQYLADLELERMAEENEQLLTQWENLQ